MRGSNFGLGWENCDVFKSWWVRSLEEVRLPHEKMFAQWRLALSIKSKCFIKMGLVIYEKSKKAIMLSLQMLKSLLEIVVEIWLERLAVKNSPEKLIHFQSSTGPNSFWAVSLVRPTLYHFNFPNFESHLAKSNQNPGLNLNRMLWPSWKLCFKNNVITFSLGKIYWFLTSLFGKMASTPMMV